MSYDLRFKAPFSLILSGVSGSGKTTWVENLLRNYKNLIENGREYSNLMWISGTNQPDLFQRIKKSFDGNCRFITELPENLYEEIARSDKRLTIIVDDLMHEIANFKDLGKLFTKGRSHLNINIIVMMQNPFPRGSEMRNLTLNTQYQVLFKNPRDRSQIRFLAQQIMPASPKTFLNIYNDATSRVFGYLLCDFTQSVDENMRFRTNIFPHEAPMIVFRSNKL